MNLLKKFIYELQEIAILLWQSLVGLRGKPKYYGETLNQMDIIGVQSLPIILLTGFFTGGVLTLQGYAVLAYYGGQSQTGYFVATSMIRELGPVFSALMIAGRVGSAISAELGAMVVSQQIDAMRALGTEPIRKLVIPRLIALLTTLPLLVIVANILGLIGAAIVARYIFGFDYNVFITGARTGIQIEDIIGGIIKTIFFGLIIGIISCHKGLRTSGGTVGVGRSTTDAVVLSSIVVIIADFFLSRILQVLLKGGGW